MSVGSTTNSNSTSSTSNSTSSTSNSNPFADLNMGDFLKLMITEMQNQDPTAPEDTSQIMQEIGQMQSISSTTQLNTTLNGLSLTLRFDVGQPADQSEHRRDRRQRQ